ncbi:FdhF/YdeP family oxidoreductase [Enterobacter wuhouensis]|uniref:FdhF/YdeP family oxidoreductase n=1 Tax=Enterobacter wuhouensis TaxID=2529381 RepID=A0A4R0G609_9ENTR|nr:FdhF/YdeP family oxidoreductase [Enterobacter wuhouensis]TCB92220.1 FdhF/YdeP family oxidoreductase [Enterobacter wuhouensis]
MKKGVAGINGYEGPAGGWGAVKAVTASVFSQRAVARDIIAMFKMNQVSGFDCPGCAWPDPGHRAPMELCENGVKAVSWETTSKKASPEFFSRHPVSTLWHYSDYELENVGRLTHPMKYDAATDRWQAVEWDVAFREIGERLRSYDSPEQVEFYTSGRTSNEAAFLYQLFAREYGSNNFPDCSNMCHGPTSVGLTRAIGLGKGTVALDDFERCDLVICIGHNPGTNHPRMLTTLREVAKRGGKIISINPLAERGLERFSFPQSPKEMFSGQATTLSSRYYQVKMGGDSALLKGIMKALIEMDEARILLDQPSCLDHAFIAEHTAGYSALYEDLRQCKWAELEKESGLTHGQMEDLADSYSKSRATIICYGLGITQHKNGTENVQQLVNLLLLKGNIGKSGAGICPLRGHSNVQGDRSVGINEAAPDDFLQRLEDRFAIKVSRQHGRSSVESIRAIERGDARALICMGGNLAVAMPEPQRTFAAMKTLDMQVHIATKLNRSHLLLAKHNYLLPALGRTERDLQATGIQSVTVEDAMSMVHASCGGLKPASRWLKSEPAIVAEMARATLPHSPVNWEEMSGNYALIREAIEAAIPAFAGYNARIAEPGGFRMDTPASRREWHTPNGKANFVVGRLAAVDRLHQPSDALILATLRSHDQYNTTIYGMDDRYRGIAGRRDVVFLSETEARSRGLVQGDVVNVQALEDNGQPAEGREMRGLTVVIYSMAAGSIGAYLPEANVLLSLDAVDAESLTPAYKSVPVVITRA